VLQVVPGDVRDLPFVFDHQHRFLHPSTSLSTSPRPPRRI
jgi:hypothetical protein